MDTVSSRSRIRARVRIRRTGPLGSTLLAGGLAVLLSSCSSMGLQRETDPAAVIDAASAAAQPLLDAGDTEGALAVYDKALARHPDIAGLHADRAMLESNAGRTDAALEDLRAAAEAAARSGQSADAAGYGDMIDQMVSTPPAWVDEKRKSAMALPDDDDTRAMVQFWQSGRSDAVAAYQSGDTAGAQELAEQNLTLAEDSFGPDHAYTIASALDLANVYFGVGDRTGAETVLALAIQKATAAWGAGHPDTLDILGNLADTYEAEGRADAALAETEKAADQAAAALGADAPRTLALQLEVARRREATGDYAGAAALLESTCAADRALYGTWHAKTAACLEQYGILLSRGGDLPGAGSVFDEVLDIRTGVLGPAARDTLQTRLDLASLARQKGSLDAALKSVKSLHADAVKALGADDPFEIDVAELQARVLFDMSRTAEARPLAVKVHEARLASHGAGDPLTLDALNLLGAIDYRAGKLMVAEQSWTEVLAGYRDLYGTRNLATITAMANLGLVLENEGIYDRAEPLLRGAVEISEALLGKGHPETLTSMNNLALLHESQGRFDRAEPLYKLPIEVLTSTLGANNPKTISVTNNLAYLYMLEERYDEAEKMFERTYAGYSAALGPEHQDTLKSLNNLGRVQRRMGDLADAEKTIGKALEARRRTLGPRHVDTLRSMRDLGVVYADQGRLDEARKLLQKTLDLDEQVLGPQHPYTFETLNSLADVLAAQKQVEEAFELRRTGFERRSRFLDRVLWVTNENAREGYVRLHRPELDAYLSLLPELDPATAGREELEVSLQRKGLLLKIASEIQQISALGFDENLVRLTDDLTAARKELASLTLSGPEGGDPEKHLARIRELEKKVEDLQGELGRASERYRESIADISVQDLVHQMPAGSSLVDFMVYTRPDGSKAMMAGVLVVDATGKPVMRLLDYPSLDDIDAAVQDYRRIIQDDGASDDDIADIGTEAWERIWKPVAALLPEGGPVYMVPDGLLNILPFDALLDDDGRYLIDTTDLHVLSSARDLLPSKVPPAEGAFMVLAGPDYNTDEVTGPQVLAAVRGRRSATRQLSQVDVGVTAPDLVADDAAGPKNGAGDGAADGGGAAASAGGDDDAPASPDSTASAATAPAAGDAADGPGKGASRAARFEAMRGVSVGDLDSRSAVVLASLRAASSGLRGLSFSPLPGAELEGNLIAGEIRDAGQPSIVYTQADAEEAILGDLKTPPRVLHVATHGFFLAPDEQLRKRLLKAQRSADIQIPPPGDDPLLRAGLAFAGVNANAPYLGEIDTSNDGVLTALEVLSLDLSGTQLAVLSACETGLGAIHEGEGVYGLRRAFQEAGVKEVVTSLWEVSDAGTQALMTAMYKRLLEGQTPREALRGAQMELKADPRWGYPYIWAAFMIVGN